MEKQIIDTLNRIFLGQATNAVMVVVVSTSDSTPQHPGARMLVMADGSTQGTVGGGAIEKLATDHAAEMLNRHISTDFRVYDMDAENRSGNQATGMLCGGSMSLYFELIAPEERFIIYGCGHIGGILAPLASQCGFQVIAVDHRTDMTSTERFGSNVSIQCCLPHEHAESIIIRKSDSIVIMTHNHQFDAAVLGNLLHHLDPESAPRYLGMIGSAKKVDVILDKLAESGISRELLSKVYTPVGLDTGGGSPGEIAVSVMAEVLAVKHGRMEEDTVGTMRRQTRLNPEL